MWLPDSADDRLARLVFDRSPDAIFIESPEGVILEVNPAACRLHGMSRDQLIGMSVLDLVPPEERSAVDRDFPRLASGELSRFDGFSWTADGRRVPVELQSTPIDYRGGPAVLLIVRDTSERSEAQRRLRTLLSELDHRVRNNLASLLSLIDLYGERAGSVGDLVAAMRGHVGAMTEAHEKIAASQGAAVDLGELIRSLAGRLATGPEPRIRLVGPDIRIAAPRVSAMAIIVQELMNNAIKHGPLGAGGGVDVAWECDGPSGSMTLSWRESGGPCVRPPERFGIGLALIEGFVSYEMSGEFDCEFAEAGFACRLTVPAAAATAR